MKYALRALGPALVLSIMVFTPSTAKAGPTVPPKLRYSSTAAGRIVAIGNALGLSHGKDVNGNGYNEPGTADSIGTFISLGAGADRTPAPHDPPGWPAGTTSDYTQNGSTAVLDLPEESEILYAELVWGGSWNYSGELTVASVLDTTSVTLAMGGASASVAPDPATAVTIATQGHNTNGSTFAANYYFRSADVTQFITAHRDGTYSTSGVPGTQGELINSLNAAGWTLIVAVRDSGDPIRNLAVYVGGSFVDENTQVDYAIDGLCVPPSGALSGHVAISAIEGDASLVGDQLLIAETAAGPFANLSGPNNPQDNFFCSQINGRNGQLDTRGTFGSANHDAQNGVNVSGGRQSWDVTTVPLSSQAGQLVPNQTGAVLRTITTGDSYVPTTAAFEIDVNAPDFTGNGTTVQVDPSTARLGDLIELTLNLHNSGLVAADGVKLAMTLDPGLSLTRFRTDGHDGDVQSNPVDAAALAAGANEGQIAPGADRQVILDFTVNAAPSGTSFVFQPAWQYGFQLCTGNDLSEVYNQIASVAFDPTMATGSGGAGGTSGTSTSTSTSSNAGGASGTSTSTSSNSGGGTSTSTSSNAGGGTSTSTSSNAGGGSVTSTSAGNLTTSSTGTPGSGAGGDDLGGFNQDEGGCGCEVPGSAPMRAPAGWAAGALLGLAALIQRRRSRAAR